MATSKSSATNGTKLTAAEMREKYMELQSKIDRFQDASEAVKQLRDPNKNITKTINTFDKETLRSYLKNIGSSEVNLRNLSWYLYYRSQVYARIINFYANMFCLDCRIVEPTYDLVKGFDKNILKQYQDTLNVLDNLRLQQEFYNIYLTCFIQDVFYGVVFYDDTGIFIFPFPADYARITGKYMSGDFSYAVDCSYFKRYPDLLEWFPEPFGTLYKQYEATNERWQMMPDEYALCLKFRSEDYQTIISPFVPLFNALINLADLEDIQAIAAEQEIYKMLVLELETISGAKDVNEWSVDPALVVDYYNKLLDRIPEYITVGIAPTKLHDISFPNDTARDTSKVADATQTVLNTAGGAEILNGATINNTYAFKMACIQNTEYAISSLLPQTQSWVNRFLSYKLSKPCKVKFFPVSVYTKADYKEQLLKNGTNGFAVRIALNTLDGFSEKSTIAMLHFENEILGLSNIMIPFNTSYTQSANDDKAYDPEPSGAPTKDPGELSDSGERSRNQ